MSSDFFFGISLTASFLAGVLALFAPCCITFLFPAYLGTVFKDNKRVIYYTFVFALGLSVILLPVALGFRFFISFFDSYHSLIYYLGALLMIFMGIMTVKPLFHMPQFFNVQANVAENTNTISVFSLGVVSGLTSACCAPVLFAAITITSLSPTLFQAILVSLAYVLGIVFPLFLLSVSYEKYSQYITGKRKQQTYNIFKYLGAAVFIFSGLTIAILNYFGKIQMYQMEDYSNTIRNLMIRISGYIKNPILDVVIFAAIIYLFVKLLYKKKNKKEA